MTLPSFFVEAFVYGPDQIRLECDMVIPIEPGRAGDVPYLRGWINDRFRETLPDLKSAYPMMCSFCGRKPARENFLKFSSWPHLPPKGEMWRGKPSSGPSAVAYISTVCDMSGRCGRAAQDESDSMAGLALATGAPRERVNLEDHTRLARATGSSEDIPRNGSCANCKTDESAENTLFKCSRCHVIQYCSKGCQKEDWSRHKTTCKWIKGARFVDTDGNVSVWKENPDHQPKKF